MSDHIDQTTSISTDLYQPPDNPALADQHPAFPAQALDPRNPSHDNPRLKKVAENCESGVFFHPDPHAEDHFNAKYESTSIEELEFLIAETGFEVLQCHNLPLKYWAWNLLDYRYVIEKVRDKISHNISRYEYIAVFFEYLLKKTHPCIDNIYWVDYLVVNMCEMSETLFL